jgi:hypothetical protein
MGSPFDLSFPYFIAFGLGEPVDARTTRLIVRSRSGERPGVARFLAFDPIHFIMERKMMLGIRDRAEADQAARLAA